MRSLRLGIAFALLSLCVTLLNVDVLGICGAGDGKESSRRVEEGTVRAWQALGATGADFLEREYRTAVAEVRSRLEYEQSLFILKFTLIGATLYVLFQQAGRNSSPLLERTEVTALVAWAAVIAAALNDLRVMTNQTFLMTLGGWIRVYEELRLGASAVQLGWEAYLADKLLGLPSYSALRVSSGILTALLFCVTAGVFLLEPGTLKRRTAHVARAGALLSIGLMTLASLSLRRDSLAMLINLTCGLCAAILTLLLIPVSRAEPEEE